MKAYSFNLRQTSLYTLFLLLFFFFPIHNYCSLQANEYSLNQKQETAIEKVIRQYIIDHPEIILESLKKMEIRKNKESAEQIKKSLKRMHEELVNNSSSPIIGNPNGDVAIVEFFDYQCGYCKRVIPVITKVLETDRNVRYVFKEFPILGPNSDLAARAALATWQIDKSKYLEIHNALMKSRGRLTENKIMGIVSKIGLDTDVLKKQMRSLSVNNELEKNRNLAKALKINGTPAFIIGGELAPGAIDFATMKNLIEKARKS